MQRCSSRTSLSKQSHKAPQHKGKWLVWNVKFLQNTNGNCVKASDCPSLAWARLLERGANGDRNVKAIFNSYLKKIFPHKNTIWVFSYVKYVHFTAFLHINIEWFTDSMFETLKNPPTFNFMHHNFRASLHYKWYFGYERVKIKPFCWQNHIFPVAASDIYLGTWTSQYKL